MNPLNFFRKEVKDYASQIVTHYGSGVALMDQKRFDEAIAQFQKVLSLKPNHTLSHYQLGLIFYQKSMFVEALTSFKDALDANRNEVSLISLYIMLAATYASMGQFEQALQIYRDALKLEPNNSDLYLGMGDLYFQQEEYDNVIAYFEKTGNHNPKAQVYLAKGYWFKGEQKKSISILQETAKNFPQNSEIQAQLGYFLSEMENYDNALIHLHKAVDLADAIDEHVLFNLADAYYWTNDLKISSEICKQGIELFPNNSSFVHRLGFIYEKQGKLDSAIKAWQRMTVIDNTDADAHHILALGFLSNGNLEAALREIEQVILFDPISASAHSTKGTILWDLNKYEEAISSLERAIEFGHILSLLELAELYNYLGNSDKAVHYAKALIDAAKEDLELKEGIKLKDAINGANALLQELQ